MATYDILLKQSFYANVTIEADSLEEALEKIENDPSIFYEWNAGEDVTVEYVTPGGES